MIFRDSNVGKYCLRVNRQSRSCLDSEPEPTSAFVYEFVQFADCTPLSVVTGLVAGYDVSPQRPVVGKRRADRELFEWRRGPRNLGPCERADESYGDEPV